MYKLVRLLGCMLSLILVYILCIQSITAIPQITKYAIKNFIGYEQQKSNWCWVASAECSGKFFNPNTTKTQRSVVHAIKRISDTDNNDNFTGTVYDIESAAILFTFFPNQPHNYKGFEKKFSFVALKAQMMKGVIPIVSSGTYNNNNVRVQGHATPICSTMNVGSTSKIIEYYDPSNGKKYSCTYEKFCDGSYNGRRYDRTVLVDM